MAGRALAAPLPTRWARPAQPSPSSTCKLDLAEEVAAELAQKQIDAMAVQADVTKPDQVQAMVDAILAKWGKLTIGVNNAGIGLWSDAETHGLPRTGCA